jgi:hypothetical protein
VENNTPSEKYTEEELMARLKFFIGICLSLTLFGIVFVVLYSLIFVTQPLNAISPIDQKFFELIVPIATFLTGTLSGIMLAGGDKDAQKQALAAANKGWDKPSAPISTGANNGGFNSSPSGATAFGAAAAGNLGIPGGGFAPMPASTGFGASSFGGVPGTMPAFGAGTVGMTASGKKIAPIGDEPAI